MHKSETLQGLSGKKAARANLDKRIRESQNRQDAGPFGLAVGGHAVAYLERKQVKSSTKCSYECELKVHVLLALGSAMEAGRSRGTDARNR